ncbi:hypothetical protein C8R47DRAFT_1158675 [Mycena vitilis]|nr:hypothetical protein C8R47DRAFT_1172570 [Mycena vitilis]KAJ6461989.1 hypothetical protein C8R47DRAFT_1158675 [Mycena vitilis]
MDKTKAKAVRANPAQFAALKAAYYSGRSWTAAEYDKLSSETGLTTAWIKSWVVRYRSSQKIQHNQATAVKREASSEPDGAPPPKKRGRVARKSQPTIPPADLPPPDDSYVPPSKATSSPIPTPTPDQPAASSSTSGRRPVPLLQYAAPGSHADYYGLPQYFPPPQSSQQPKSASPLFSSHPQHVIHQHSSVVSLNSIPQPRITQQPKSSASRPQSSLSQPLPVVSPTGRAPSRITQQHKSSATRRENFSYPRAPVANGPMLLPRQSQFPENIDPVSHSVPEVPSLNMWATPFNPMAYRPTVTSSTSFVSSSRITRKPIAQTPLRTTLFPGIPLPPPPNGAASPPKQITPVRDLQPLPFESPFCPYKHTDSSLLRSDYHIDNYDSPPTMNTPIDDHFLFSSMLNLTPEAHVTAHKSTPVVSPEPDVWDIGQTALKHISVLRDSDGALRSMPVDEMRDRLLAQELASSDPFQAAMGLVFMSRTGLKWE